MRTDIVPAVVVFFVALFAYTKFVGPIPFSISQVTVQKTDTFSVTGEGKAFAVPNMATATVGVTVQGTTASDVQQQMNTKINAVTEAIRKLGIDAKDIKTANYNVSPVYDYRVSPQKITGYQANTNITVTIRDTAKANSVVDAATAAGANIVGGVTFDIADKAKAENEARTQAVAEARKKAEDAAKIAGFRLGRVINYQEGFGGPIQPLPMRAGVLEDKVVSVPTQLEPGQNEIRIQVTLSYEIL